MNKESQTNSLFGKLNIWIGMEQIVKQKMLKSR